ncbi:MAG: DNA-directed RNA polymerase subunit alpha [Chloroflexi bacterium]|nr:DNA-directed RNA polymerase subunit alpha [Chloroflexota bacterium]
MSRLVVPVIECVETRENFGRFVAKPLERGFGVTLGNALRRVLLSYLPGAAVTWVKIDGIQHEFSVIPSVKEDTMDFTLNVKSIRLKSLSGQPARLKLDVEKEGTVCAGDIQPSNDFEVVNPELHLASVNAPSARLHVEFNVELGEGYRTAETSDNLPIGAIPVDSIFSPVRKVNFTTEPAHIGRETSHEQLNLEVWTDGTIAPGDAVSRAAEMLIEQLSPFINYTEMPKEALEKELARPAIPDEKYNMPVEQLDLSVRTMNCLRRGGITTVGELVSKTEKELLSLRNFGQKSKNEIDQKLASLGLSLVEGEGDEKKVIEGETEEEPSDTEQDEEESDET